MAIHSLHAIYRDPFFKEEIKKKAAIELVKEVYKNSLRDQNRIRLYLETELFKNAAKKVNRSLLLLNIEAKIRPDCPCSLYKHYLLRWLNFVSQQIRGIMRVVIDYSNPEKLPTDLDLIVSLLLLECNSNVHFIVQKNYSWYQKARITLDPIREYKFINNLSVLNHISKEVSLRTRRLSEDKGKKKLWCHFEKFIMDLKKELIYIQGYLY